MRTLGFIAFTSYINSYSSSSSEYHYTYFYELDYSYNTYKEIGTYTNIGLLCVY